jgi:hypothetical protein
MRGPLLWAGREPHMQLDEFFAAPVYAGEEYAKTVSGILKAHKYICAQVRKTVEEKSRANTFIKFGEPWADLGTSNFIQFAKHL